MSEMACMDSESMFCSLQFVGCFMVIDGSLWVVTFKLYGLIMGRFYVTCKVIPVHMFTYSYGKILHKVKVPM